MMLLWLVVVASVVSFTSAAARKGSCVGRCGQSLSRTQQCSCDVSCLRYQDCCLDFQKVCDRSLSCYGRCGEIFTRGRPCDCDAQCVNSNSCCHDYHPQCNTRNTQPAEASASARRKPKGSRRKKDSESEEHYSVKYVCPGSQCKQPASQRRPLKDTSGPAPPPLTNSQLHQGPESVPSGGYHGLMSNVAGDADTKVNVHLVLSRPSSVAGSRPQTNILQDLLRALGIKVVDSPGTGEFADQLCSDSPINAVTSLINGTILIFKGQLFWSVEPLTLTISRPQSITDTLGVPAPIDTVFTRSNCAGTTYIIKGDLYWRLNENLVLEPGFPKPLSSEFPGHTGVVSAVLAGPATISRPETLYFFYNGDTMQTFIYPAGSSPTCSLNTSASRPPPGPAVAEMLQREINVRVSMKGFPLPVTSALSIQRPLRSNTYEHYVFTGPLFFIVEISTDLPVVVEPDPSAEFTPLLLSPPQENLPGINPLQPHNSITVWLQCVN